MASETSVCQERLDVPAKLHCRSDHGCKCSQSADAKREEEFSSMRVPEHGLIPAYGCIKGSGMEARTGSSTPVTGTRLAIRTAPRRRPNVSPDSYGHGSAKPPTADRSLSGSHELGCGVTLAAQLRTQFSHRLQCFLDLVSKLVSVAPRLAVERLSRSSEFPLQIG